MAFLKRFIDVSITLNEGFFSGESNTVNITGHRVACVIRAPGGYSNGDMSCLIYGLGDNLMTRLTSIGLVQQQNNLNQITITAGSEDADGVRESGVVYTGTIWQAWADYSGQPNAVLQINAYGAAPLALNPSAPVSFEGSVTFGDIMSTIARVNGYALDNQDVQGQVANVYLDGASMDQIQSIARAGNFKYQIDDTTKTITIMPIDGHIGGDIPIIAPDTGMIGYPTFAQNGVMVRSIFNRFINNNIVVDLKSSIPAANGKFTAYDVVHTIESENQESDGAWFTDFRAFRGG